MSKAKSKPIGEMVKEAIEAFNKLSPEEQLAHRRAQAISFAYGQLALTKSWKGTREDVERAYDDLHGKVKSWE